MASERDLQDVINTLIAEGVGEGEEGMRRIAETILNRAEQRGISPAEVVRQRAQYTGYSAPGPAAVRAQSDPKALTAAQAAWQMAQGPDDPTGGANHYWNPGIVNPSWAGSMHSLGQYGNHAFATDRAVAPQPTAPTPASQSPLMASSRAVTSPSGGNTALQNSLAAYATREGNRVTPATMQGRATTVATIPTTQSLRSPGAVNASVASTRQDPTLAAALAARSGIGQAPATRTVPTVRVGNSANNIAAQRNEQAQTRQANPVRNVAPVTSIPGPNSAPKPTDRLSPTTGIDFVANPAFRAPTQSGGLSRDALARQSAYTATMLNPPAYTAPRVLGPTSVPSVNVPMPRPMPQRQQAPIMAAAHAPVAVARAPIAAPVQMPLMAQRPIAQAPLNILVQGSNTVQPRQVTDYFRSMTTPGSNPNASGGGGDRNPSFSGGQFFTRT